MRGSLRRRPLTWFFSLAYLLSWLAWTPYILSGSGVGALDFSYPGGAAGQLLGVLPGAYLGPLLSAFLVTHASEGRAGLRGWLRRMAKWRVSWRWYVGVILSAPAALTLVSMALGGTKPVMPGVMVLVMFVPGLLMQMITTGLAEEPGWRDFAMPHLQRRHGALIGTLIIGPLWGVWHLPLFLTEWGGWPDVSWWQPAEFVATTIAFSFVMTWVFNRTGESLPLAMLLHVSVNNYFSVAWSEMFPWLSSDNTTHAFLISSFVATVVLLIATRGRLGYQPAPVAEAVRPAPAV
ncbi:CPBP family intramembrane glutamic endopeptidase [Streptomyces gelaticus]|uniref:CPBP family intramembrane glutamic endopeptidase n=1 Tax=Streptomyces gelaticus TaxID=285446 RepID=UPI0037A047D4